MNEKIMRLFLSHLKIKHNLELYDYQKIIAQRIFDAVLQNLRLTLNATPDDIKKLKREEIAIEISRQAGKTTDIVAIIEYVITYLAQLFQVPLATGIFAPQREQSKTDFDRLKSMLRRDTTFVENAHLIGDATESVLYGDDIQKAKEESNAKTLVLPNGSSCFVFPITPTSLPESKTLHIIVVEEAQDADDKILKEQIWPMGSSTNAVIVYIGTAGTKICHFYRLGQMADAIKIYFEEVARDRQKLYEETGDAKHLFYEQNVRQLIEKYGIESDEVQRPYFGKWLIGTGQFTTDEDLDRLYADRSPTYQHTKMYCFAGIDTAKNPDSTVVTVLRWNPQLQKKEVINWLELRGDNYQDQFDIIKDFLGNYNIVCLAIDSTGQGDFMPDMFEKHTKWKDENSGLYRIKFSAPMKDQLYKNLKVSIKELLTTLPKPDKKHGEKFRLQMLDLQQEFKGQLLSVHHPDSPDAHDDYPDSWALAEWAYAKWNENQVSITSVTVSAGEEREVVRDEKGRVTDHWPG